MSQRGSILAVIAAATLGFALMAWVSTGDSVQMLQTPRSTASPPQLVLPTHEGQPPATGSASQTREPLTSGANAPDLTWVRVLLAMLLISAALIGLGLFARWAWQQRRPHHRRESEIPFEVLPEVALAALIDDAPATLATLELGTPRNAIVACWLRLEEAVAVAGFPRDPAETSAEFTARVLGSLAVDAAMFNGFARFYREARFSEHVLGEPARRAAIAALRSLYDDIAATGTPIQAEVRNEEVR